MFGMYWSDDEAARVDPALRRAFSERPDRDDPPVSHRDVPDEPRRAGSVHHAAPLEDDVVDVRGAGRDERERRQRRQSCDRETPE